VIVSTASLADFDRLGRLDAWYFLAPGAGAARRLAEAKLAGLETVAVGGPDGLGRAWMPNRLKQVLAVSGEESVPYIKPHDVFQYLPSGQEPLAVKRTPGLDAYRIRPGLLLQTRSGRNLGPNAVVDKYLAQFVVSDDLIRVDIPDEQMRFYAVAFLRSRTGQGLLRRDKSGTVIDHLSPAQIEAQEIPLVEERTMHAAATAMKRAFELTQQARESLRLTVERYEAALPSPARPASTKGWAVNAKQLGERLDAAPHDPWVDAVRRALLDIGGQPVSAVADVIKPPGRYKTIYVDEPFGRPFMSGTQILQLMPQKRQWMAPSAFSDVQRYELRAGWSAYQADGRAEKKVLRSFSWKVIAVGV